MRTATQKNLHVIDFTCSFPEDVADEFDAAGVMHILHDQPAWAAQEFAQEMCERSAELAEQFDGDPGLPVVVEWQGKT